MINILEFILNIIYPNVCGICERIDRNSLCDNCRLIVNQLIRPQIYDYAKDNSKNFRKQGYIFKYEGIIRNLLIDYKFNDKPYLYKTFSNIILSNKKICDFIKEYEIIIPVPIHKKRKNKRGYNQSELLARELSRKLENIILKRDVLVKIKDNRAQSTLRKKDRVLNVKDAYTIIGKNIIEGKKVLLIDDIYTTGSTVNECSKILKNFRSKRNRNFYDLYGIEYLYK